MICKRKRLGLKGCGQEDGVEVLGCFGEECKSVRVVEVRDEINRQNKRREWRFLRPRFREFLARLLV